MRYISDKVVEKQSTHCMFSKVFPPDNPDVYEIMWKNTVEPERSQTAIQYDASPLHAG
jgi:hypothetical protein